MAFVTAKPTFSTSLPQSGKNLLMAMTDGTIWQDTTLQYYLGDDTALSIDTDFASNFYAYFSNSPDANYYFTALTDRAFAAISAAITLDFSRTTNLAEADQVLVSVDQSSNIEGFSTFAGVIGHDGQAGEYWSFTTLNSNVAQMRATPETGGGEYANWTILHEIGHSLGLFHPFEYPASQYIANMDNERYTVMSYTGAASPYGYGHAVTMMALDIAALQALYGEEDNAGGNSTYMLMNAQGGSLDLTGNKIAIGRAY